MVRVSEPDEPCATLSEDGVAPRLMVPFPELTAVASTVTLAVESPYVESPG